MEHIDASSFSDLTARVSYMSKFLDLTSADSEALVSAAPLIAPLVPTILEAVYVKLLSFDITAQAFVPKNTDYTGETVQSVQELTLEHPQIAMRKDFLKARYPPPIPLFHSSIPCQSFPVNPIPTYLSISSPLDPTPFYPANPHPSAT